MLKGLFFSICLGLLATVPVSAATFGIGMGESISKLDIYKPLSSKFGPGVYVLKSVPNPYPGLTSYVVNASKTDGVCSITGNSDFYENDLDGSITIPQFKKLREALDRIYGNGRNFDVLKKDSNLNKKDEWSEWIIKKKRVLLTYWNNLDPIKTNGIGSIMLQVNGALQFGVHINLSYESSDFQRCMAAIQAEADSTL